MTRAQHQQPRRPLGGRRHSLLAMAMLVLWQALAVSFHLASEQHFGVAPSVASDVQVAASAASDTLHDGAGQPHVPHSALDHEVAQEHRAEADLSPASPCLWLPSIPSLVVPRDVFGELAGAPPTGPPRRCPTTDSIAARAPPRA